MLENILRHRHHGKLAWRLEIEGIQVGQAADKVAKKVLKSSLLMESIVAFVRWKYDKGTEQQQKQID